MSILNAAFDNGVPENIRDAVRAIMWRFNINGLCDAMYLANTIAHYNKTGDGAGHFEEAEIIAIPEIVQGVQTAYGYNVPRHAAKELENILKGYIDPEAAVIGMRARIEAYQHELGTCDEIRMPYVSRSLKQAKHNLACFLGNQFSADSPEFIRIYQPTSASGVQFMSLNSLSKLGMTVDWKNYRRVYSYVAHNETLDEFFEIFNCRIPQGYTGYSLSVGDIIVLSGDRPLQAWFVDRFGFANVTEALLKSFDKGGKA